MRKVQDLLDSKKFIAVLLLILALWIFIIAILMIVYPTQEHNVTYKIDNRLGLIVDIIYLLNNNIDDISIVNSIIMTILFISTDLIVHVNDSFIIDSIQQFNSIPVDYTWMLSLGISMLIISFPILTLAGYYWMNSAY